jgi:hypothetical protein
MHYDNGAGDVGFVEDNLIWAPQIESEPVPQPPSENPNGIQANVGYYYAYNFQYVINLINESLIRCFQKLQSAEAPTLDTQDPPFMTWEKDNTVRLYARADMYDTDTFPRVEIYFNRSLYSLLSSLPSIKVDKIGVSPTSQYFQLLVKSYYGARISNVVSFGIHDLIYVDQEYSTIDQFTPVSSILLESSTIPVIPNQQSNPQIYIDGQPNQLSTTYNKFANVITDITADNASKPTVLYIPSGEYRMISLMNNQQPLHQIDIQCKWMDKTGEIHDVMLSPNSSVSLKIMFRRKKNLK